MISRKFDNSSNVCGKKIEELKKRKNGQEQYYQIN